MVSRGIKTITLHYPVAVHAKLKKKKEDSGCTSWESWVLQIAGIEEEE
jgi:hypothetical protein